MTVFGVVPAAGARGRRRRRARGRLLGRNEWAVFVTGAGVREGRMRPQLSSAITA